MLTVPKFLWTVKTAAEAVTPGVTIEGGSALFGGVLVFTDGTNDPTLTIYDNITNSGRMLVPATTYDAVYYGNQGFMPGFPIIMNDGIHIVVSLGAGTGYIVVFHRPHKR